MWEDILCNVQVLFVELGQCSGDVTKRTYNRSSFDQCVNRKWNNEQ